MKTLTVLSGKGGTGKTSISASLAVLLSEGKKIVAVDCDVDAPNFAIALGIGDELKSEKEIWASHKSKLSAEKCIKCGKCAEICAFNAIKWDEGELPEFNQFLCEGCGACTLVCPAKAIELIEVNNASAGVGNTDYGFKIISGQLKMGESGSGKVVDEIKHIAREVAGKENSELMLVDAAAGIGCPVIAAVRESDFVVGIAEPTPSGFSDLKRALGVVEQFGIPYGVIINIWDLNREKSMEIEGFLEKQGIPLLGKISYDKDFVKALVEMKPAVVFSEKIKKEFQPIVKRILENIERAE